MKFDLYFALFTNFTSLWITDLNLRAKIIKLPEEIIGRNLRYPEFGKALLNRTSKEQTIKVKHQ